MSTALPDAARVVVIGGGIVGASIAYHLVGRGERDVLLLERDRFTSGTTWHAAGLVAQLRATEELTQLSRYSLDLYQRLEAETGQSTGFQQPGAISLATTPERATELARTASMARHLGVEAQEISPTEVAAHWPEIETRDVVSAVHLPHDAMVSPVDTTQALLAGARTGGARLEQRCPVTELVVERGRIAGVMTEQGVVRAEVVVLAAGIWSRQFASRYGVTIPLHAAEHYYAITQPVESMPPSLPILRDPDHCAYFKPDAGKLLIGLFEPIARPWPEGLVPDASFIEIEPNLDHVLPLLDDAFARMPGLRDIPFRQIFCGPESFTPDDRFLLGEAPTLPGLWVAAGFNSIGIQAAGGVGWVLAEWILDGRPPMDLWSVDIGRFEPFAGETAYLRARTVESLGLLYQMHWPTRQPETARNIRCSPLHERSKNLGACFGELSGWERPLWFSELGDPPVEQHRFGRSNAFEHIAAEHRATRERVGLYDQTSYAKFVVEGADALSVLQQLSANEIDVEIGKVVYTQWLNNRGGIEADLTVTRIGTDRFWVVTAPATRARDRHLLERAISGTRAVCRDITEHGSTLGVMGPHSRELLQRLSDASLSNLDFPFGTSREIEVASVAVRALRITYVGELGWELYVPTERALELYDALLHEGPNHGLRPCGFRAMLSCRIEKGYRHWGHDVGPGDTPLEAGLGFAVAWQKTGGFVGREALLKQRETTLARRLLHFRIDDPDAMLHHDEPIWRNDERMGLITSGTWGHTLDAAVGLGWAEGRGAKIDAAWVDRGRWEIEIAGRRFPARASLRSFYDPRSRRVREAP
ncbi:FAD-dependent oxidoreductase [Myxococcota bacterium]|nr:FAD-dependent oxidoreductase [Myxococcota bacterium]